MRKERKLTDLKELGKAVSAAEKEAERLSVSTSVMGGAGTSAQAGRGGAHSQASPAGVASQAGRGGEAALDGGKGLRVGQTVLLTDCELRGKVTAIGRKVSVEVEDGLVLEVLPEELAVTDDAQEQLLRSAAGVRSALSGKSVSKPGGARSGSVGGIGFGIVGASGSGYRAGRTGGSGSGYGVGKNGGPVGGGERSGRRSGKGYTGTLTVDLHLDAIPGGGSVARGHELEFQMSVFRRVLKDSLRHRGMRITFIHGVGDGVLRDMIRRELDEVFALRCTYTYGLPGVTIVTIR